MPDVKLSVSADVGNLNAGLAEIGRTVDGLGNSMQGLKVPVPDTSGIENSAAKLREAIKNVQPGGMKWSPFDMRATERDIAKLRQQMLELQKLAGGKGLPFGVPSAVSVTPASGGVGTWKQPGSVMPKPAGPIPPATGGAGSPKPPTPVPALPPGPPKPPAPPKPPGPAPAPIPALPGPVPALPPAPLPPLPALPPNPAPPNPNPQPGPGRRTGRHSHTYAPDVSDIGRNLISGFGGGVGTISSYATRGAIVGAQEGGGAMGGGLGLLRGGLIGAGVLGALKVGQGVSEGYDMAKERNTSLDELMRQMGSLGGSFNSLKLMSDLAADGLNINQKEAAKLAVEFNQLSHGAEKSPEGLTGAVRTGTGISQAYGLAPAAGVNFLGGMRQLDPRQNNRELALMLAETLNRSHMQGNAGEVMQAIQSLSAASARLSLSIPNASGIAGAYGGLMGSGTSGMTHDGAVGILSQANSTVSRFGGMGEAGKNFMYSAINAKGSMNPIDAMALAEGGLFGSRNSVFGDKNSAISKFYEGQGIDASKLAGGANGDTTTLDSIRDHIKEQYKGQDKRLMLDGFRNVTGINSLSNAGALFDMPSQDASGLGKMLKRSKVGIDDVTPSGLQTIAGIGAAKKTGDLNEIYAQMVKRTGAGALNAGDKAAWEGAQGSSFEAMQDALVKIAAAKDMEQTDASQTLAGIKAIEKAQLSVGDLLIKPMNTMRDALVLMSNVKGGTRAIHEKFLKGERDDINENYDNQSSEVAKRYGKLKFDATHKNVPLAEKISIRKQYDTQAAAELAKIEASRKGELSAVDADGKPVAATATDKPTANKSEMPVTVDKPGKSAAAPAADKPVSEDRPGRPVANVDLGSKKTRLAALEKQYGLTTGTLLGVWGAESSFGANTGMSSAGASGNFQFKPGTAKQYGVKIGDFNSESDGAARYLKDLKQQRGSDKGALFGYNGVVNNIAGGEDYVRKVQKYGEFALPDGPTPMPVTTSQAKPAVQDTVHFTIEAQQLIQGTDGKVVGQKTVSASMSKARGSGASRAVLA